VAFEKATALRSAPSKDRQIAGVYTAIPREGKAHGYGGRCGAGSHRSPIDEKRQCRELPVFIDFPVIAF
jgi:hypothetical protein